MYSAHNENVYQAIDHFISGECSSKIYRFPVASMVFDELVVDVSGIIDLTIDHVNEELK